MDAENGGFKLSMMGTFSLGVQQPVMLWPNGHHGSNWRTL